LVDLYLVHGEISTVESGMNLPVFTR